MTSRLRARNEANHGGKLFVGVARFLALALLLAGCSTTRLAYESADTLLRWRAYSYLDVRGDSADALDAGIAGFVAWHRTRALPHYVGALEEAARRMARGLSRADIVWGYDSVRTQLRTDLRTAANAVAGVLDRLTPAQIEHLEKRLQEDNRKFAAEHLTGTPAERRDVRAKRNIERLEDWVGRLSEAQNERVRLYSRHAPLTGELRDLDRKGRQAALLAMVRARTAHLRLGDWAANWDAGRSPEFDAASRAHLDSYVDMLAAIDSNLSAEQRARAAGRFRDLAQDFGLIARRSASAGAHR